MCALGIRDSGILGGTGHLEIKLGEGKPTEGPPPTHIGSLGNEKTTTPTWRILGGQDR